ncbi:hypothetical protein GGR28_001945 [Lewinella aquimaris]|uniref:Peptidyl-prolyl cis-trans isomerase n=1 Tax=Neolewinella aquimaris TaxID=1835722 RepID=A0A840E6S7_9BACT|nr:hypothetical protein [Neolewinella aquimaris]MBB4079325.1 hypothetical protein [Neolewinella aquimaris]
MKSSYWGATAVLFLLVLSCAEAPIKDSTDPVLARVHQRELRLSEMEGMFPERATAADSAMIVEAFVNRWARDAVLLWESEQNAPSDLNLDRLVRDYRASLVRSSYEEQLVSTRLDSAIGQAELEEFYEASKEQYQLEKPIVRCLFIRVPYPTPEEEALQDLWNNGKPQDTAALADYSRKYAEVALLSDSTWYSLEEVAAQLPEGTLTADNVNSKREFSQLDGTNRYYFRLFELKPRREIAPLSYVVNQARRAILHGRKREVLERAREEIFERELRRNNIEFFTNR